MSQTPSTTVFPNGPKLLYRLDRGSVAEAMNLIKGLVVDLTDPGRVEVPLQARRRAVRLGALVPASAGRIGLLVHDLRGCVVEGHLDAASQIVDLLALTVYNTSGEHHALAGNGWEIEVTPVPENQKSDEAAGASRQPDLATRLGLSPAREAIQAWREEHRKSLDPKNRKPPTYTDYGGGVAVGMDVPDYD